MNADAEALHQILPYSKSAWRIVADFMELMKPELTSLSVLTAICSFYLAHLGAWIAADIWLLANLALGTTLVGGGAGALNQYLERNYDAKMKRTEKRPLPAGRLMPGTVLRVRNYPVEYRTSGINLRREYSHRLSWRCYLNNVSFSLHAVEAHFSRCHDNRGDSRSAAAADGMGCSPK